MVGVSFGAESVSCTFDNVGQLVAFFGALACQPGFKDWRGSGDVRGFLQAAGGLGTCTGCGGTTTYVFGPEGEHGCADHAGGGHGGSAGRSGDLGLHRAGSDVDNSLSGVFESRGAACGRGNVVPPAVSEAVDEACDPGCGGYPVYRPGQLRRGPNYLRNCQNRARKKLVKEQRKAAALAGECFPADTSRVGRFDGLDEAVRRELVETHARRLVLENKAKIQDLLERDAKRGRGVHHLTEAMKLLRLSKEAQDLESAGVRAGAVAGWVRTVSSELSESVARASSAGSFKSKGSGATGVSSGSSASQAKAALSSQRVKRSVLEQFLVTGLGWTDRRLVQERCKVGRALVLTDLVGIGSTAGLSRGEQVLVLSEHLGYEVEESAGVIY